MKLIIFTLIGVITVSLILFLTQLTHKSYTSYKEQLPHLSCPFNNKKGSPIPWFMSLNFKCLSEGNHILFLTQENNGFVINSIFDQKITINVKPLFGQSGVGIEIDDRDGGHLIEKSNFLSFTSNYNGLFYIIIKPTKQLFPYLVSIKGEKKSESEVWHTVYFNPTIDHRFNYSFDLPPNWEEDPKWQDDNMVKVRKPRFIANSFRYFFDGNTNIPYYFRVWNINRRWVISNTEMFISKNGYSVEYKKDAGGWNAMIYHPQEQDVIVDLHLPKVAKEHEAEIDQYMRRMIDSFKFTENIINPCSTSPLKYINLFGFSFPVFKNENWLFEKDYTTVERWQDDKYKEYAFQNFCCLQSKCQLTSDLQEKFCNKNSFWSEKFKLSIVDKISDQSPDCLHGEELRYDNERDKALYSCSKSGGSEIIMVNGEFNNNKFTYTYDSYRESPPVSSKAAINFYLFLKNDKYLLLEWICDFNNTDKCISSIFDFVFNNESQAGI